LLSCNKLIRSIRHFHKQHFLKYSVIPFAVLSSTFIASKVNAVHAESATHASVVSEGLFGRGAITKLTESSSLEGLREMSSVFTSSIEWFKKLPAHVTAFTTITTSGVYELVGNLILKTPLYIFSNEWFEN